MMANAQWWDLITVANLIPYFLLGPSLIKMYRRGAIPDYCLAFMVVSLAAVVAKIALAVFFDVPAWVALVFTWIIVVSGITSMVICLFRHRGTLRILLTAEEKETLDREEHRAFKSREPFNADTYLADMRRSATAPAIRKPAPYSSPEPSRPAPPASLRLRSAVEAPPTGPDRPHPSDGACPPR